MPSWDAKLASRLAELPGVAEGDSMFADKPAYWANAKEIAHSEADGAVEVRLTKLVIREHRAALKADPRVTLRRSGADWVSVRVACDADIDFVVELVTLAERAHRPPDGAIAKPPPTGSDLERRRRFH